MAFRPNHTRRLTTKALSNLRAAIVSWEKGEFGRAVTPQAYKIIVQAVSSITADPSRHWMIENHEKLQRQQDIIIESVPEILSKLASRAGTSHIDTFTLLHSISELLDSICPFDKPSKSYLQHLG